MVVSFDFDRDDLVTADQHERSPLPLLQLLEPAVNLVRELTGARLSQRARNGDLGRVAGLVLALDTPPAAGYEILNLGCSNPVENLRFVEVLEGLLGKKAHIIDTPTPPTEPLITYADISKARRLLGYEPKVQVEEGLARFIAWLRQEKII